MKLTDQVQKLNELEARVRDPRTPMDTMITLAKQAIRLARLALSTSRANDLQDSLSRLITRIPPSEYHKNGIQDAYRSISSPSKRYQPWYEIFKKWR